MKEAYTPKNITLLFTGDLIPPKTYENIFSDELRKILKVKDFSIVNLEAPLTLCNKNIHKTGDNFKASPEGIRHIKEGFFDAVTLSNNHIRDFGDQGINDTLSICKQNNILTVGAGADLKEASVPLRIEVKGVKISILNYSEKEFNYASEIRGGSNPFELIDVLNHLKSEKRSNDFVFLIYHGGIEYHHLPTLELVKLFKFLIESGVDCIISHHTHRYSGLIYHQGKPIFFGLGNFFLPTKSKNVNDWIKGLIARIQIRSGTISAEIIPTKMKTDFISVDLMPENEIAAVNSHLAELAIIINNENLLRKYWHNENTRAFRNILYAMTSNTLAGYRLKKRLPFLFHSYLTRYRHLNLLNMINCYSHRNRMINILEDLYKNQE